MKTEEEIEEQIRELVQKLNEKRLILLQAEININAEKLNKYKQALEEIGELLIKADRSRSGESFFKYFDSALEKVKEFENAENITRSFDNSNRDSI